MTPPAIERSRAIRWTETVSALAAAVAAVEYLRGAAQTGPGQANEFDATRPVPTSRTWRHRAERAALRRMRTIGSRPAATRAISLARLAAASWLVSPTRRGRGLANGVLATSAYAMLITEPHGTDGSDEVALLTASAMTAARSRPGTVVPDAALSFLAAQSMLSYAASGFAKALSPTWTSGRALELIVRTRAYGHHGLWRALHHRPAMGRLLTRAVVVAECAAPFALALGRGRTVKAYVAIASSFHAANGLVMGLGRFMLAFAGFYPAVLYAGSSPTDRGRALGRLTGAIIAIAVAGSRLTMHRERQRLAATLADAPRLRTGRGSILAYHLEVADRDASQPVVVMEAGLAETAEYWEPIAARLAEHWTVIRYTRAGYPGSESEVVDQVSLDDSVADLIALIDELAPHRRIVLLGHSLGGSLVRCALRSLGGRVDGVVLLDPSHRQFADRYAAVEQISERFFRATRVSLAAGLGALLMSPPDFGRTDPARRATLAAIYRSPAAWRATHRESAQLVAWWKAGPDDEPIQVPTLIVTSEGAARRDPTQLAADQALAAASRDGVHHFVGRAGHVDLLLDPQHASDVADRIRAWLVEVKR